MTYYDESRFSGLFGGRNTPNRVGPIARASLLTPIDWAIHYGDVSCGGTNCFVFNSLATRSVALADLEFEVPQPATNLPPGSVTEVTRFGDLDPQPDFVQLHVELMTLEYHGYNNFGSCLTEGGHEVCGPWQPWTGATVSVEVSSSGGFREQSGGFANTPGTVIDDLSRAGVDPDPFAGNPSLPPRDYTMPGGGVFLPDTPGHTDANNVACDTLWNTSGLSSITAAATGAFSGIFVTSPATYHPLGGQVTGAVTIGVWPFWLMDDGDGSGDYASQRMLVV